MAADPNFPRVATATALGLRAAFAFPVVVDTEVVAVLEFFATEAREPAPELLEMMGQVGSQLGHVLERTRAEAALRRARDELAAANRRLTDEISVRTRAEAELARLAFYDPLSSLPNRSLFLDRLEHALKRSDRACRTVAVLFLDLDNFKVVNDSLGHEAGDRLLAAVAERLEASVREGDTAARFGGDEFTILLEDIADVAEAVGLAERLGEAFRTPMALGAAEVFPSFSVGIALGTTGQDRADFLIRNADIAMYHAKAGGKACVRVFDERMNADAMDRLTLELDLRRAIDRGELRLVYQPILSLEDGRIGEVEALIRWDHPVRGLVSPAQFIPIAEETGIIMQIDRWVLGEACRQAGAWQIQHLDQAPIMSVNLSARQFAHPSLVNEVRAILAETGLDACLLKLEITETALVENAQATIATMRALKVLGVQLAIDDFGTGYSSLNYLKQFPVDTLKIDRSFVDGLGQDTHDSAIVRSVIALARSLGLATTGEGIETPEQLHLLRTLGCDRGQGFYFAKPLAAQDVATFLGSGHGPWLGHSPFSQQTSAA